MPPPAIVVEDKPLTTNSKLSETTLTFSAVKPRFVIVYVIGAAAVLIQELPCEVIPDIERIGAVISGGTSSPKARSIGVPPYPAKLIFASWVLSRPVVGLPKNILPPVPEAPAVPVQPLIVKVLLVQVSELLGANIRE